MTKQADLTAYLFDQNQQEDTALSVVLGQWMEASPRFTAFVDTYRDKIRKKIRVTRDAESVLDLRSELELAYRLLDDRRLALAYEPYASAKRRGPDFAVTYRVNLTFNIEVARLRRSEGEVARMDASRHEESILRILRYKLGQMQPGMPNLLAIHTIEDLVGSIDLGNLMQAVKRRAESKDPAFYAASRYASPAEFYKDFLHLGGILLWSAGVQLWTNKQARPELAEPVARRVALALTKRSE